MFLKQEHGKKRDRRVDYMSNGLSISVCIATYNGEKYIQEQLETIFPLLIEGDEVIISDDGSTDNTIDILNEYRKSYPIYLVNGPQEGFSSNFGNAVLHAKNDIIVFSDQDDIWAENKLNLIREAFEDDKLTTLLHNMATFRDHTLIDTEEIAIQYHPGVLRNFIKSCYWGCCMAVRREFVQRFLPFRKCCVGHDQLIGLMSEKFGKTAYINQKLIWHRLHQTNTSNHRTVKQMIDFRIELQKDYRYAEQAFLCGDRHS